MASAMDVDPPPTNGVNAAQHDTTSTYGAADGSDPSSTIPLQALSKRHLVAIEYPGRIRPPRRDADGNIVPSAGPNGLERALTTLAPEPPPLCNPTTALQHITTVVDNKATVIECHLGATYLPPEGGAAPPTLDSTMFRSPLLGVVLPTNNPVLRIRRRRWRRKRASRTGTSTEPEDEVVKEYTTDFIGSAQETIRFRAMADYAYEAPVGRIQLDRQSVINANLVPGLPRTPPFWDVQGKAEVAANPPSPTEALLDNPHDSVLLRRRPAEGDPCNATQALRLHAALTTMNSEALRNFKLDPELQEYQTPGDPTQAQSLLQLVPPPRFTDQNPPYPYFYKQPTNSVIVDKVRSDGKVVRRWENQSKYRGIAPVPWRYATQTGHTSAVGVPLLLINPDAVPHAPNPAAVAQRAIVKQGVMEHLEELFNQTPTWTRPSLLAALGAQTGPLQRVREDGTTETVGIEPGKEYGLRLQRYVAGSKVCLALICYNIQDSPWRDVLVRHGYDVRTDPQARFAQRIGFRPLGRKGYSKSRKLTYAYGAEDSEPVRKGKRLQVSDVLPDEEGQADEEDRASPGEAGDDNEADYDKDLRSHIFDGVRVERDSTSFLLRDITDPQIQILVQDSSSDAIRTEPDVITGWYTEYHWELIKEILGVKYRKLVDEGRPATDGDVRATLKAVRTRFRRHGLPIPSLASSSLLSNVPDEDLDEQEEDAFLDAPDLEQSFVRAQALVSGSNELPGRKHRGAREAFRVSWQ